MRQCQPNFTRYTVSVDIVSQEPPVPSSPGLAPRPPEICPKPKRNCMAVALRESLSSPDWEALFDLAVGQAGYFTTAQAAELGRCARSSRPRGVKNCQTARTWTSSATAATTHFNSASETHDHDPPVLILSVARVR